MTGAVLVADPCFLYVWRTPDSHLAVYRSVLVNDTSKLFDQVRSLVGDTEPVRSEVIEDADMVFGQAELLVYLLPESTAA
ncbi:hypothetical protein [Mycolicibacter virginiensis]|uniref:hypothetical protein n=1 Tax=Mycolicibacter virginiensis TaxID=1795032 RepID=UPI001F04C0CE|nr:hypothetical protein [Mycolicibacter virginiensis]ULP48917.1 hypothetical protein MJO54_07545 [Mycolicibacter virginiensis]